MIRWRSNFSSMLNHNLPENAPPHTGHQNRMSSNTFDNETLPNEWTDGIIVKICKKGNLRDCNNWRGMCVLPAVSKIIAKVIFERLRDPLISTVDAEQAGFRAGSSCTDHINSVSIKECKEFR